MVVLGNNYGLIIDFFGEVCYNVASLSSRCVPCNEDDH